ncbi:MAG: hypothetical protein ACTSWM_02210 [Alphaproteobacteria bacterium]
MAEPVPLRERSLESLNRGLVDGEFNIKDALLAQRIIQQQRRRPMARWSLPIALICAALAAGLMTATIIGLF